MSVKTNASAHPVIRQTLGFVALACGAGAVTPAVLADGAGTTAPVVSVTSSLYETADALMQRGKFVQARAEVLAQLKRNGRALTEAQRKQLIDRLDASNQSIDRLAECEKTLQESEMLIAQGDLRMAHRKVSAVMSRTDATEGEKTAAQSLAGLITERQTEIKAQLPAIIKNAAAQFERGNHEAARELLASVYRSGAEIAAEDRLVADSYQVKLMDLDRALSGDQLALAQPGTVRREQPAKPAEPAKADEPAKPATTEPLPQMQPVGEPQKPAEPAEPAKAAEPAKPAEPAKAAEPVSTPEPEAKPAEAKPAETQPDYVQIALKADAQRTLAEADAAFDAGRYSEALRKYSAASTSQRGYLSAEEAARADRRLNECKVRLRDNTGGTLADDTVKQMELIRQRSTAEFTNQIDEAGRSLAAGDTKKARDLTAGADVTIKNARAYYSQAELDAFAKKVNDLNARIAQTEDQAAAAAAKDKEAKLAKDAQDAQTRLREEKERKIYDSLLRVRELQRDRKYTEALQIIDQVLYLDPNNATAQILRDTIGDLRQYDLYNKYKRLAGKGVQQGELDTHEALVPPVSIVAFPADWPQKTFTRTEQLGATESPENRRAMASLEGKKIPVQFKGVPLENVLAYIAKTTNTDVDPNWESLKSIGVEPSARVNLSLMHEVTAKVALERVLGQLKCDPGSKLDWAVNDGVVTVASADTIKRHTTSLAYNITDLLLETPNYKDVPELDLARVLANKSDLDTRSSPFAKAAQRDERSERADRIRKILDLMQRTVDPESWREQGGETGSIAEHNGTLIITQTPRNHAAIAGLLSKLREIRSLQINVESRFLLVSQDFFEQIGFNVSVYFNAQSNVVTAAQQLDPGIRPSDFFDFTTTNGTRRVIDSSTYAPSGSTTPVIVPPGPTTRAVQNTVTPTNWSPIGVGSNSLGLSQGLLPAAGFARDVLSSAPALGIAGTFLDDIQVDFLVKATQADRRTVTLTAPRLTLTNGQTSNVYVVTQRAIVTDLEPVVGDSAVGFDPTTGTVAEGVVMLVEAVVSADRRYVTMNIDTSVNTIREIANQEITATVAGALQGSGQAGAFIQLPVVQTTRVQTTSTVPDEGTLLLGGQRIVTEVDIETGVPVLSKIPIINRFFTNRIQSKEESTLMILVKPTVLIQTEEEEKNFPGLLDSARTGLGN